jgi:hypothetical protein
LIYQLKSLQNTYVKSATGVNVPNDFLAADRGLPNTLSGENILLRNTVVLRAVFKKTGKTLVMMAQEL